MDILERIEWLKAHIDEGGTYTQEVVLELVNECQKEIQTLRKVREWWIDEDIKNSHKHARELEALGGYKYIVEEIQKEIEADTDILKKLWNIMKIAQQALTGETK